MEKINQDENYLLKINPENTNTIDINQNQTKSNDITSKVSLQLEITDIFNELSELFSFAKPAVEAKKLYYNKKGSKRKSFYYKNLEKFSPEIRSLVTDGNIKCKCELSSKKVNIPSDLFIDIMNCNIFKKFNHSFEIVCLNRMRMAEKIILYVGSVPPKDH